VRPLRVAYVTAFLRPGGAERQMIALAERLPRDRFEVEFVLISGSGPYDARAAAAGARIRMLGATPSRNAPLPERTARRAAKMIKYALTARRARYDVVDAWLYPADILATLMRPVTGTPVVISGRRNVDPHDQLGPLEAPIGSLVRRMTDAVVANSAAAATHAVANGSADPAKIRIIRNGVELIDPVSDDERVARRRAVGATDDEVVIGCVANYLPVKRLDLLVDAFGLLVRAGMPVRLVIVGEGMERPALERQLRELGLEARVRLHGAELAPEPLYAAFDIVAQSSTREGLPNSLLEAASAGRAIVATDAGGTSEIVFDGRTGLLVPVNDRDALTAALRRLVVDVGLRGRLGVAARAYVAATFGMDRFSSEFARLYEQLAVTKGVRR
jgi:glycosyltransferase involved in cell wall biosynthesis